jgi:hypothetical protein
MYLCQHSKIKEVQEIVRLRYPKGKFKSRLRFDEPPASGEALDESRCGRVKHRRHKSLNAGTSELEA